VGTYANAEALVSTDWVLAHSKDPGVVVAEVDVDTAAYDTGHVPGAVGWNWQTQLHDQQRRDILSKAALESLLGSSGISPDTTVVLYGDNSNWFAAWAYWQLKLYGHRDARIMDGGRKKWLAEGRPLSTEAPRPKPAAYKAHEADRSVRALLADVRDAMGSASSAMVDVRSPDEFTGKILAPPGLPETCQVGGHIPGARNIPWSQACNEDGTFKSADALKALYAGAGITPDKDVISYCRIGERSSHTWFVLKVLLGYPKVRNYDGSWTEWGNLVGAPVER
jgi:thiosulfate/3-mercaptopyruvate sulfurtransferase